MVQGLVVFSDGRSTEGPAQAFEELRSRADRAKVPILTVVVGEHRQPINIRITDLQAPEQARPEDKFPVRIEIDGEGLPNADMEVHLDVTNPKKEKKTVTKMFKFNAGAGGPPHAQSEFEIDAAEFGGPATAGKPAELEEGEWKFVARVAKDKREIFMQKEHLSSEALVHVVKKQIRVLLFAGGPSHDYQFVRNLLVRAVDLQRVELSVCLQIHRPGVVQDESQDLLLSARPSTVPSRLHFKSANAEMEFLKLDEEAKEPLAGWEQFFTGSSKVDAPVVRGFYSYYPVSNVKPSATVVATFADPRARIDNGQKEQPYLVTMPFGNGKVVYLGSGETWRLRQYREIYHERFWTKLARYAGSGNLTRQSRRGVIVRGREFPAGQLVPGGAHPFGRDLRPLPEIATPQIQVQPPHGEPLNLQLKAKPSQGGEWAGWFQTRFRVTAPGEYRPKLKI